MKAILNHIIKHFIDSSLPEIKDRNIALPFEKGKIFYIMGPARAGKTFVLFQTIKKLRKQITSDRIVYIDFNDLRLFPPTLQTLDDFLESYYELYPDNADQKVYFFFDDIWRIKNWESFVKRLNENEKCAVCIAGPGSISMMNEINRELSEKIIFGEIYPLGFDDYYRFKNTGPDFFVKIANQKKKNLFSEYLSTTSFPGLLNRDKYSLKDSLNEYLDLVIYKFMAERYKVSNIPLMKYLLKYLLSRSANFVTVNQIYNEMKSSGFNVSRNSVYEYIEFLEDSYMILGIKMYTRNLKEAKRNPTRYYPVDTGLAVIMTHSVDYAKLLETVVCFHIKKRRKHIFYCVTDNEVNFVVIGKEGIELIAVYYDAAYSRRKSKKLESIRKTMEKLDIKNGYLLTSEAEGEEDTNAGTIKIMPGWKWMLNQ